jgi:signal transduction histidine kinase
LHINVIATIRVAPPQWLKAGLMAWRHMPAVAIVTALTMIACEKLKDSYLPHLTLWHSHLITILVAVIAAVACTYWSVGKNVLVVEVTSGNTVKRAFLSAMSREFRTPLNVVLGMADMLGETELSIEQRRYITTLIRNGDALLKLIDGILDQAQIEKRGLAEKDGV